MGEYTNPSDTSTWAAALSKHSSNGELDYDGFYNEINYVSPGIHILPHYKKCLSLLKDGESWMDAGCGCGHHLKQAITDKNIKLFGMDVVEKSVDAAINNGINCVKHSISEPFPYEDDHFDLVTSTDVLEHLSPNHVDLALSEIYRVTKRGKHAMLAPHPKPDGSGLIHLTVKPTSWWREQCEKVGFTFVEYCGDGKGTVGGAEHYDGKGIVLKKL